MMPSHAWKKGYWAQHYKKITRALFLSLSAWSPIEVTLFKYRFLNENIFEIRPLNSRSTQEHGDLFLSLFILSDGMQLCGPCFFVGLDGKEELPFKLAIKRRNVLSCGDFSLWAAKHVFPFAVFNTSSPLLGIYIVPVAEKVTSAPFKLEDDEEGRYLHIKWEVGRISVSPHKSYLCFHVSWCDVRRTRVPDNHTPPSAWNLLVSGRTTVICA